MLLAPLLPLLLLLLLPLASPQAGRWAEPSPHSDFGMNQPKRLSAPEGGSIHIPFSFYYPWDLDKVPNVRIFWRWKHFHAEFIYITTPPFTHEKFKNRLVLNWTEGWKNGSLQIRNLRMEDEAVYFCRVELNTRQNGKKVWQSIKGTQLFIIPATTTTTAAAATTTTTITVGLGDSEGKQSSESWPLSMGATAGLALAGAVLITLIVGLIVYFTCKRSKGLQTKARTPARGSFQNMEEKYENTGNKVQHTNPKLDPKDDGICYASLTLSSLTSPAAPTWPPPHRGPQEETVYSALKA
ncbi:paired immunoglobulin-like type 2 receptor alpha [Vicugna pacos]|uniref:paired immunoglobulin-like type 2 receptor alpha n=1 Tax=Vicugna pacos TaxID=30538 RepID=UPI003BB93FC7